MHNRGEAKLGELAWQLQLPLAVVLAEVEACCGGRGKTAAGDDDEGPRSVATAF